MAGIVWRFGADVDGVACVRHIAVGVLYRLHLGSCGIGIGAALAGARTAVCIVVAANAGDDQQRENEYLFHKKF